MIRILEKKKKNLELPETILLSVAGGIPSSRTLGRLVFKLKISNKFQFLFQIRDYFWPHSFLN
jgi:hypothetical protein